MRSPSGREVGTAGGGARHYQTPLRALRWRDIKMLISDSLEGWSKHKGRRLGASMACYALLSLAPLLLVFVAILGLVFGHTAAEHDIVERVRMLVGKNGGAGVEALLEGSRNTKHGIIATTVGLIALLFGASGVMIELRDALNTIWEVPTREVAGLKSKALAFIKAQFFSLVIVLWIGVLLIVLLTVTTWITAAGAMSASLLPAHEAVLHILDLCVSFILITFLFAAIYKVMPDVHLQWHDVVLGAAVTSLLFTAGKVLLAIFLGKVSFASTYGAFASIVALVAWVYYSGQIFFLGAEFTRTFGKRYGSQPGNPEGLRKAANETPPLADRQ
ncbi:MAG: YihY/virulence factor BrkB family protein [Acidobacteriaceae bacterium]|nr:YihY/virulence factor BrkB family protein [Acidobacteriaceae bacterium]